MKENSWPHVGQKPSVRPGRPSLLRPTGLPHLAQVRLSSGTSGFFITTLAASTSGTGGIVVRPAPSRAERSRWDDDRTRWVAPVPLARCEPMAADSSRNEPLAAAASSRAPWNTAADAAAGAPAGVPHTSQ